ncbi:MAG: Hsp70 family protein [Rhodococcus sp. (in: high G+C Gram-positive bacteria)]
MTVLLGVSMGAHAVRLALPRGGTAVAPHMPARLLEAPQQLFFKNRVIDTVDGDVEYLAAESISEMAAESEPSMATGVAYRDAHQANTLHRALEHQHLQNYHLVHEVEAVVEYLVASGESAGYSTVALYDLGSSGLNVSVVDLVSRRIIVTQRSAEFSGDLFDRILRDNQLDRLGKPSNAPDIELFTRRCRVAKERLSGNDAVCLPDDSGMILLSRDSYETLISDEVDRSIEFARDVMIGANVPIEAVVLIGGGSRIPLVRKSVGPSLGLPALTPNEPESVAARGAALSARPAGGEAAQGKSAPAVRPLVGAAAARSPRPSEASPTISIARKELPASVVVQSSTPASAPAAATVDAPVAPAPSGIALLEPPAPTSDPGLTPPESKDEQALAVPHRQGALKNVYWLDADYEDDDGEDDSERKRRLVRSWSIAGVAAAAIVAMSAFLLTRPSTPPPAVDTAVNDAPAASVAPTTSPVASPSASLPPVLPPPPAPTALPEPEVATQQEAVPQYTPPSVTRDPVTQEAPAPAPAPVPVVPPAPEPPPLIPGLPNFTLPTIPPLFPPPAP